ncbi:hypothetical protein ABT174_03850 [Streptomyces sparsogenes]|uniref:hypothetical protein n=1 Tax=Streptomyces sparsogenes TaxID=67365 RepID=UPI00331FC6AC
MPGQGGGEGAEALREGEVRVPLEREVRALLERGVPRLAAPAQRMRRVRQLVVRRRRRRVVGVVGAAGVVGGVTAAVTLAVLGHVPGRGPGGSGATATYQVPAVSPAATGPTATGPDASGPNATGPDATGPTPTGPTPTGPAATGPTATGPVFRYPGLGGLTVRLPSGWSGRDLGSEGGGGAEAVGVAGSRPAAVEKDRCTDIRRYCLAPDELRRGEGLLVLRLGRTNPLGSTGQRARLMDTRPGDSCRLAGGTRELVGWRAAGDSRPHELITASVCLNRPSAVTLEEVRGVLGSARFQG